MDDQHRFTHRPTVSRPLLGQTILLVEDSLFSCDAVRLLTLRSGGRIRRADCLGSARRHLSVYRPSVMIIDVGLPDGSGTELIAELSTDTPRVDVILATSGDPGLRQAALDAGADDFLVKPVRSLGSFQSLILGHLPAHYAPPGVRMVTDETITPDPVSLHDDLDHITSLLATPEPDVLRYAAQFLASLGQATQMPDILDIGDTLHACLSKGGDMTGPVSQLRSDLQDLVNDAGQYPLRAARLGA